MIMAVGSNLTQSGPSWKHLGLVSLHYIQETSLMRCKKSRVACFVAQHPAEILSSAVPLGPRQAKKTVMLQ